jgi:hypothetical protein
MCPSLTQFYIFRNPTTFWHLPFFLMLPNKTSSFKIPHGDKSKVIHTYRLIRGHKHNIENFIREGRGLQML